MLFEVFHVSLPINAIYVDCSAWWKSCHWKFKGDSQFDSNYFGGEMLFVVYINLKPLCIIKGTLRKREAAVGIHDNFNSGIDSSWGGGFTKI